MLPDPRAPPRPGTGIASLLAVYDALKALGWKRGDTLLYQPNYDLTEDEQRDFSMSCATEDRCCP